MASTVTGSLGGANAGAIVSAISLLNNVSAGVVTSDVAAASTGNFSLSGLVAGSYQIKAVLNNNQNTDRAGSDVTNALFVNTIVVDGSSSYRL
jgi:hypothetical protein